MVNLECPTLKVNLNGGNTIDGENKLKFVQFFCRDGVEEMMRNWQVVS